MKLTITHARTCLGQLCARAQDPRETIVLTRHSKPLVALMSIEEAERIWDLQDADEHGPKNPLSGRRGGCLVPGMVPGLDGTPVTPRNAALQMREVQMARAEERRILQEGGLVAVEGGEVSVGKRRKKWWRWPRFHGGDR